MSIVLDVLRQLGVGGSILMAASLGLVAFYLVKVTSGAKTVGGVLANGVTYAVVVLVAVAISIALGWVDPNPSIVLDHVHTAMAAARDALQTWIVDRVSWVLG